MEAPAAEHSQNAGDNAPHGSSKRPRSKTLCIAVEGCCHGRLADVYDAVEKRGKQSGRAVDVLLICGDFQAVRNPQDLACMAVPDKYKEMGNFYKYYTGELKAPMLTIVIGGNHEASNYMQELFYGGWLAPNIYYLGQASVVRIGGLRLAGLSGIFNERHYMQDWKRLERPPYTPNSMRSIYHVRPLDIAQLSMLTGRLDIFLSHDWPSGIAHYGNVRGLLARKKFLQREVMENKLGSPPSAMLLHRLRPHRWFAAHMHVMFSAHVRHEDSPQDPAFSHQQQQQQQQGVATEDSAGADVGEEDQMEGEKIVLRKKQNRPASASIDAQSTRASTTEFLALDKCLPGRKYLQVVEVEVPNESNTISEANEPVSLEYDPEWLGILELTQPFLAAPSDQVPTWDALEKLVSAKRTELTAKWSQTNLRIEPSWFEKTVPTYDPARDRNFRRARAPRQQGNPQTDRFLAKLGLEHRWPVTIPCGEHASSNDGTKVAPEASASIGGLVEPSSALPAAVAPVDDNEIDIDM